MHQESETDLGGGREEGVTHREREREREREGREGESDDVINYVYFFSPRVGWRS